MTIKFPTELVCAYSAPQLELMRQHVTGKYVVHVHPYSAVPMLSVSEQTAHFHLVIEQGTRGPQGWGRQVEYMLWLIAEGDRAQKVTAQDGHIPIVLADPVYGRYDVAILDAHPSPAQVRSMLYHLWDAVPTIIVHTGHSSRVHDFVTEVAADRRYAVLDHGNVLILIRTDPADLPAARET